MKIQFSFVKTAVERHGYKLENVHRTLKNLFAIHDLPCTANGDTLFFEDKGHGDDFAVMWDILLSLLRSSWFMDCAASCVWRDEDGEEDILAQAGKLRSDTQ